MQSLHAQTTEHARVGELSLSVALGYGEKSNPLYKGDAFPLVIVPSIYYYGKNWYFDNGDLGVTLAEQQNFSVNLLASVNGEAAHFHDWHPANILVSRQFVQIDTPELGPEFDDEQSPSAGGDQSDKDEIEAPVDRVTEKIVYDQVAKRKWSLDTGVQIHWFVQANHQVKFRWMYDVTGVHQGHNSQLEYSYKLVNNQWRHKFKIGLDWLSSDLVDYYYGISARDSQAENLWYQPGDALLPYIGYASGYKISQKWSWVLSAHYQQLTSEIERSPIVAKDYRYTLFTGMKYVF
ncbi:MipA/OmpV family protein [Catenovulum agarivorans]|uniref:MipA/OmpV family protein n=1 Tax=Catenovulum agarivorans TaxID=1172192 RepID=UPI0013625A09|nr:MipA/OmpV family protein [Catenovulum agarivorans]